MRRLAMIMLVASAAAQAGETRLPLERGAHGTDGALVLTVDDRLTPVTAKALQEFQWFGFGEGPPVKPPVTQVPLAEAELKLVDGRGQVLASLALGSPFAALSAAALLPGRGAAFVLEVSNGGFGQFTGTIGRPFAVEAGRLRYLTATSPDGPVGEIELKRAPRTDWLVLPATGGKPGEMLQAACLPGQGEGDGFAEVLTSWRWEGDGWRRRERTGRGYCNWSPGLPPLSAFP